MQDDDGCVWWCGQVPLQVVEHADHADVNGCEWSDVTLRCLSPPLSLPGVEWHLQVLQGTVHNETVISVGCGQRGSISMTQSVSLHLCGNLLGILCDSLSSMVTSI
ncbi:hypothetical protein ATANTOWER_019928 [Ataeniobius toweri]|uniref:Uncharacterized protein n=1 Tax=Ataeniobius toweri TaxID=208326 RepID=A0ABU7AI73_9TELE|nr:hypothetical protein [Ataeniobius toweri]